MLRLSLSPSPRLAALIVAVHAAAALGAWLVMPGATGALLGCALLALGAAAAWSRALLRSPSSVRTLELGSPGIACDLAGGARFDASVSARRYVSRYMVALLVREAARGLQGRTILVTRDMVGRDSFRLLRIWALWGKLPPVAAEQLGR